MSDQSKPEIKKVRQADDIYLCQSDVLFILMKYKIAASDEGKKMIDDICGDIANAQ